MNLQTTHWLDELKIALLQKDEKRAFELSVNLPDDLSQTPLESKLQARELLSQVIQLLEQKKQESRHTMEQIRAVQAFLQN
ncbi:hypothetical protein [Helicobacter himalayensis]|uniref:hypothetical protein n=1 Tax=Helicobacter himalayensis TaxID=1591088 RepID=UPI000B29BFBF|nr:hypothetical protein [Helicobacter himalayensis]